MLKSVHRNKSMSATQIRISVLSIVHDKPPFQVSINWYCQNPVNVRKNNRMKEIP